MKKELDRKYIIIIVILSSFFVFFSINRRSLTTDSGFDSSWDSGSSWDSDSSWSSSDWGSDSDWGSGRSYSSVDYSGVMTSMLIIIIVVLVVPLILLLDQTDDQSNSRFDFYGNENLIIQKELLARYKVTKLEIVEAVKDIVRKLEYAYSRKNLDNINDLISNKLKEKYQNKINELNDNKLFINNLIIKDAFIYSVNEEDNILKIHMDLVLKMDCALKKENSTINESDYGQKMYRYVLDVLYNDQYIIDDIKDEKELNIVEYDSYSVIQRNSIEEKLEKMNLTKDDVICNAYEIYVDVQKAWMNDSLDDVKDIISSEIYNTYSSQLATLRVKKQQNVMSDFEYVDGFITSITTDKKCNYIKVILCVKCKDYLINKESQRVLRGSSSKINMYRYSLIFMVAEKTIENCPNCSASLLEDGSNVKCEYCGSVINRYSKNMVLTDKKMISQQ